MTISTRFLLGISVAGALFGHANAAAALELPETYIAYRIEAELDPATRRLKGTEEIRWTNRTDTPITALPLHLYLNSFAHDQTTWMRSVSPSRLQLAELLTRAPDPWGYMDPLSIKARVEGLEQDAAWRPVQPDDGNALDRSLGEVTLPAPVPPGGQVVLNIAFEGRLPVPIARTGGDRDFYLVAQWYPKIGVIEPTGVRHAQKPRSAARQFHGNTEFYADFADYDVTFKVPSGWLIGATGRAEGPPAQAGSGLIAARYKQRAVHDFALVAGATLRDEVTHYTPKGGGPAVEVRYIVTAGAEHQIPRLKRAIEAAFDVLGSRVGPYPYETLTVVTMPYWANATSGMEYPTFITGEPSDPLLDMRVLSEVRLPEAAVIHEFGHQYFYGLLASNEQDEAFLDEGFNSYWENEILQTQVGMKATLGYLLGRGLNGLDGRSAGLEAVAPRIHEPIRKMPSWLFASGTSGSQIYGRSEVTFATAARLFGQEKVDRTFAEYFRRFAFKHPDADDFLAVAAEAGGPELTAFYREAFERESIPNFAVTKISTKAWEPPLGRVMTDAGPVMITRQDQVQHAETGLPPEARESDGRVLVEITDAGWVHDGQSQMGSITKTLVTPEHQEPARPDTSSGYQTSSVHIEGPGWSTLPVDVEFRFADGAVVRDTWDGKAAWRTYRFLRHAPIVDARIDPADRIKVDVTPQDNALSASADKGFATDWGLWLGAAATWLAGGLTQWL